MSQPAQNSLMGIRRRATTLLALCLVVAALLGGCTTPDDGGDDGGDPPPANGDNDTGDGNGTVRLSFMERGDLGEVLVDGEGRTLYVFSNDEANVSNCYGQCAVNWPPLLANEIGDAPSEIEDRLTLIERDGGDMQVAYDGLPLYHFVNDEEAGDVNGDGLNGIWFVVRPPPQNPDSLDARGPHNVTTSNVTYFDGTTGFLSIPDGVDDATGIVMIHEWWGLNDNIRNMSALLATHGYRVLAVDLFEGNVATTPDEARQQVVGLDQERATENLRAAAAHLRDEGAPGIASLGWCFGGGQSLQLALSGEQLEATVLYYGTPLVTDEDQLQAIDWPVLGIFGVDDQAIPVDDVRAFEDALGNLSIEHEVYIYPQVGHAFANPSGDAWSAWQAADAWQRTLDFLAMHTGG